VAGSTDGDFDNFAVNALRMSSCTVGIGVRASTRACGSLPPAGLDGIGPAKLVVAGVEPDLPIPINQACRSIIEAARLHSPAIRR
jgi:hypothetical protein